MPMADNPDLAKAVSRAIFDPGKITPRRQDPDTFGAPSLEPLDLWQARAVLEAVRPFITGPSPEQMLREFHRAKAIHGGLMPERPTADLPDDVRDLRIALLDEEVGELRKAMLDGDIIEIADGIADVVFVAVGTAVPYGVPFDAVFAEVHRSNMTKVNHTPKAKLTKGPGYEPPDIARVLGLAEGAGQ